MPHNPIGSNRGPVERFSDKKRRIDRNIDELIGLAKGMVSDDKINDAEANYLIKWLKCNHNVMALPPVIVLYNRVVEMLEDGVLSHEEQEELLDLLREFGEVNTGAQEAANFSAATFLDKPAPIVQFPAYTFCFTGKFLYGSRYECEKLVHSLGGDCSDKVHEDVDYLVVGFFGNNQWAHTGFGRKVENAMQLKLQGKNIMIVSEDYWLNHATGLNLGGSR